MCFVSKKKNESNKKETNYTFRRVVQTPGSSLCVCKSLSNKMSKRLASSTDDGASNNTEQSATNANQNIINLDDSDDDDDDMQFVGIVHPAMPTIDLCVSPSTSAAAAAAAAVSATATAAVAAPSTPAAAEALKTANIETDAAVAVASNATPGADASNPTATLECPICLQTCIHPARLPCGHIFCFLCVKGVAYKNRRCAMCRREIPAEFLDHPQLVNGIDDICATRATEDGYQWYYEGRNGGWWAYDVRTNEELETSYQSFLAYKAKKAKEGQPLNRQDCLHFEGNWRELFENVDYDDCEEISSDSSSDGWPEDPSRCQQLICGQLYIIDLIDMTQSLRSQPSRKRNIIRRKRSEPAPGVKGVAGLKHNAT
ncbi:uncharacterized protein LOC108650992 isoform X3 [Drosophila navojoa]|uniref:uncharacterized protein LOC108650992 isoform X3 n=1 Tax=Drosophila navojoa TaxID=7232 RepID=UPI0008462F6B|nr:uncharacterized protein LOC108650992 isoform X3 [Drosophila navojoa]